MITPNGRFAVDKRLCLSISDFHPESWVPTWSVATILNGVLSFMIEDSPTTGSIETTLAEKRKLRDQSIAFNQRDMMFCSLFPDLVDGTLFTPPPAEPIAEAPAHAIAPPPAAVAPTAATPPIAAAPPAVPITEPGRHGESAGPTAHEDESGGQTGEGAPGKNAAKNKKKREKAAAKRREQAGASTAQEGDDAEVNDNDPAELS